MSRQSLDIASKANQRSLAFYGLLPGWGLLLGYACSIAYSSTLFENELLVEGKRASYTTVAVSVPARHEATLELPPTETQTKKFRRPVFGPDGAPVIETVKYQHKGRGVAKVLGYKLHPIQKMQLYPIKYRPKYEVEETRRFKRLNYRDVIPIRLAIENGNFDAEVLQDVWIDFDLAIQCEETGFYETIPIVEFDNGILPERWAICGSIIAAIFGSLAYWREYINTTDSG